MSWRRYDDGYEEHEKIVNLIAEAGYEAYYRLGKIHGYCARQRTEGHIPQAILRELGVTKKHLAAMIALGLVDRDEQGDLTVHDWHDYNPKDVTNAERQARFRNARRNAKVTEASNNERNGEVTPLVRVPRRAARPVPEEPSSVVESVERPAADDDAKNDNEEEPGEPVDLAALGFDPDDILGEL